MLAAARGAGDEKEAGRSFVQIQSVGGVSDDPGDTTLSDVLVAILQRLLLAEGGRLRPHPRP